jgi:hypothetical protein
MELVFVHPYAALVALLVALPLAALWVGERRSARVRSALGLRAPRRRRRLPLLLAAALLAALLGAASAQPVLVGAEKLQARQDAEAYVVVDITRSMLASSGPEGETRFERAVSAARRLRAAVPDVPVGLASFTNRTVPHIFPTLDRAVFGSGLTRSLAVEQPPPDEGSGALLTAFDALAPLQTHGFFTPGTARRIAIVVTDGETRPVSAETIQALRDLPRVELLLVRVWREGERIHRPRAPIDRRYRSDPSSTRLLQAFAAATRARVYGEGSVDDAAGELRRLVGSGERVEVGTEQSTKPLAAWTLGLALVPLGYLLWRRNI